MTVKVFVSWGSPKGKILSEALTAFLSGLSPEIDPFCSPAIGSGQPWRERVNSEVLNADVGVAAITPDFASRSWPMWEVGGLYFLRRLRAKRPDGDDTGPHLFTVLWGLGHDDLKDTPLAAFQHRLATSRQDMKRLAADVACMLQNRVADSELGKRFSGAWKKFLRTLNDSEAPMTPASSHRYTTELIEDIWMESQAQRRLRRTRPLLEKVEASLAAHRQDLDRMRQKGARDHVTEPDERAHQRRIDDLSPTIERLAKVYREDQGLEKRVKAIKKRRVSNRPPQESDRKPNLNDQS